MKRNELLNHLNDELLDRLFGFCYARTGDSYEAEELCSDILYALVRAAGRDGDITQVYPFIWKTARNVYADFSEKKRRRADNLYAGDADEILAYVPDADGTDDTDELLAAVYRRIAFLTQAYRDVMIRFYLEGLSVAEIAQRQHVTENTVRQRLFSARQKIRSEVKEMSDNCFKPVALDQIEYEIWGTGNPGWDDPRNVCTRMLSRHIVWLCRKKPKLASEIAAELNVPTVYVEEELEILRRGENGKYGLLRRLDNGRYAINFILFDRDTNERAHALYTAQMPNICSIIAAYIETHKAEYLAFPYLNRKPDLNLILWQQIFTMSRAFAENVERILREKYFADAEQPDRPFSVFGFVWNGKSYGGGWDTIEARNLCSFSRVRLSNIYITRIKKHFGCGHNAANDQKIQLALRAIDGLNVSALSSDEQEQAARAIECGYLFREGDTLYTKILVSRLADWDHLFDISEGMNSGVFEQEAEKVAAQIAALIRAVVPAYLHGEWQLANRLANMPVLDGVVECLIERGILIPPENGIGAEGCWMLVEK